MSTLTLEPVIRGERHLHLRYRVDDFAFTTTYWYDTVDFRGLGARFGDDYLRLVEFHLLAFEANKALSPIHHRMPVILAPADHATWLDPESQPADLQADRHP